MTDRTRTHLPEKGAPWADLEKRMQAARSHDIDWRGGRTGVYVFNAGDDVMEVGKKAFQMFHTENALGAKTAFPSLQKMHDDVIEMGLGLFHGPEDACGDLTSGGTESILLAVKTCRDQARAEGRIDGRPNLVIPVSAHPAFNKAGAYFDVDVIRVPVDGERVADVPAMAAAINSGTIMLVGSAPSWPYGLVDPIEDLGALAVERGLWLHVDACVGGYFLPFARDNGVAVPAFDFRVPGVSSLSADLHKYGFAPKSASTLFHRSTRQREHQIFEFKDWPGGAMQTPTMPGTRPGGAIAGAWATMNYLGRDGYRDKADRIVRAQTRLIEAARDIDGIAPLHDKTFTQSIFTTAGLSALHIWKALHDRGWFPGLITEPLGLHMMVQPKHLEVMDDFLVDLEFAVAFAREHAGTDSGVSARYS